MANAYVEGTITEIGFSISVNKEEGNGGQKQNLPQTRARKSCWLKLKPSADFIRKEGDLEKVMIVSADKCRLRLLKTFEAKPIPIDSGVVPTLVLAKANHLTIRISFGTPGALAVSELVVK